MKLSSMLCASFVALAASAITADGAPTKPFAVNAQRLDPYKNFRIGTAAGTTEADCVKNGGTIIFGKEGKKTCALPGGATDKRKGLVSGESSGAAPAEATSLHFHGTHTTPEGCATDRIGSATSGAGDGKASVYARTNSERGVWKAPAGEAAKPCDNGKAGSSALEKKDSEALDAKTNTPVAASPPPK